MVRYLHFTTLDYWAPEKWRGLAVFVTSTLKASHVMWALKEVQPRLTSRLILVI